MPKATLTRQIGLFDATMIMVGMVIGSGIFLSTGIIAASGGILLNSLLADPAESLAGLGLLATGIPAYHFWRRRRNGATPSRA